MTVVPEDHEFALLLTHDVDRPYKTYQFPYYALRDRDPGQLWTGLTGKNPFWTFDDLCAVEDELGVRSSFNFLDERHLFDLPVRDWFKPKNWRLFTGRYSLTDPAIVDLIRRLESEDWEVGLHGSYFSYLQRDQLEREKVKLESILEGELLGGRQHYLNIDVPLTWRYQRSVGLKYDTSLGSNKQYGFGGEYGILRPFDDDFVVFPLTVMETALPDPGESFETAWRELDALLDEAAENDAVMSVLWHPRFFAVEDFPGHRRLYRRLVRTALERGAWVGSPGELYKQLEHPSTGRDRVPADRQWATLTDGRTDGGRTAGPDYGVERATGEQGDESNHDADDDQSGRPADRTRE
ncbi:polysaccharide deacetylase family protein [Haloarchaeobius sp. HRN-SO-5]|uniref:polysaccharide deacetylase family protein n=1 Tax=Haloarchaeobius sp. HRN-SO-5 TaxID=3446118 RepID=UPI003EB70ED9